MVPFGYLVCGVELVKWTNLAEVDGNRTRRTGFTHPTRFEGGGAHQALGHLQNQSALREGRLKRRNCAIWVKDGGWVKAASSCVNDPLSLIHI